MIMVRGSLGRVSPTRTIRCVLLASRRLGLVSAAAGPKVVVAGVVCD